MWAGISFAQRKTTRSKNKDLPYFYAWLIVFFGHLLDLLYEEKNFIDHKKFPHLYLYLSLAIFAWAV
jgi:hypothetical protein